MSRQAQLPPRHPFQRRTTTNQFQDPVSPTSRRITDSKPHHHKSISQSFILEEQPAWLNDLLSDLDSDSNGVGHRRSASDSSAPFAGHVSFNKLGTSDSCESDGGMESSCTYGPNSPRRKGKLTFPENAIVSALSEFVSQNPLHYSDESFYVSEIAIIDKLENTCGAAGETHSETKPTKRHPGQRSRLRKLQYIAELEQTVNSLQSLESELAVKVASVLQQRVTLSLENSKLKQQLVRLQQEKLLADGQYRSLRKEAERLKACLGFSPPKGKISSTLYGPSSATELGLQDSWQMLDIGKLNLS